MNVELHHICDLKPMYPLQTTPASYIVWWWITTHGQLGYTGNCDVYVKSMVTWQEVLEIKYVSAFLCMQGSNNYALGVQSQQYQYHYFP